MPESLYSHNGGILLLCVHDLNTNGTGRPALYSCITADIGWNMNDIPVANLVIGQGTPLSGSATTAMNNNGQLEDLLQGGIALRNNPDKLLRCSIYEVSPDSTDKYAVFRGYVVGVSDVKKTGGITIKALRVQCMGIAVRLNVAPIAGYRRTRGGTLINGAVGEGKELPTNGQLNSGVVDRFSALYNMTGAQICAIYKDSIINKDIVTRAAYLSNLLGYMGEVGNWEFKKEPDDELLHVKECMFCNYVIGQSDFGEEASNSFNVHLYDQLLGGLQQGTVLQAIARACTGFEIMLNMVPHFERGGSADAFRMELMPSKAWDYEEDDVIEIEDHYIVGSNAVLNHLEHLGDPEVLVVDYASGAGSTEPNKENGQATGCIGVFSPDPDIMEWAKIRFAEKADKTESIKKIGEKYYKVRYFTAPKWMDWAYLLLGGSCSRYKSRPDDPGNNDSNSGGNGTIRSENRQKATELADEIAKSLWVFLHGASDTATFELTPNLRFGLNTSVGCLENHIGRLVDINGYRGMLQSVRYSYATGKASSCSLSITLNRVRLIDKNEEPIPFPLYTKLRYNQLYETTDNAKYWSDSWDSNPNPVRNQLDRSPATGAGNIAQQIVESVRQP